MGHWIQVKDANIGITYTGGYCLKAVADAFGTQHKYPTAAADWQSGEHNGDTSQGNHDGQLPPNGVKVPIYLKLTNVPAGDVAISLGDGRVASAAQSGTHNGLYIYSSIQAYINDYSRYNGGATYLGWSEGTENTRVVSYQADITTQDVVQNDPIQFTEQTQNDPLLPVGETTVTQEGVNGSHIVTTRITYSDGVQTGSQVISDVTNPPVSKITSVGTAQPPVVVPVPTPVQPTPNPTPPVAFSPTLLQSFIDFLVYIVKNVILGVK